MEYLDFYVRVAQGADATVVVSVDRSPAGSASSVLLATIEAASPGRAPASARTGSLGDGVRGFVPDARMAERPQDAGRRLFDALLNGDVLVAYRASQRLARSAGHGLRLRLRVDVPHLAVLPWEMIFDPETSDFVALSSATPIVREVDADWGRESVRAGSCLRVLAMTSAPADIAALDASLERARMLEATASIRDAGLLEVEWVDGATWRALQLALQERAYHVFHFIGHADFDEARRHGVLILEDDNGRAAPIGARDVGRLLADHVSLRLVVLNACSGAREDPNAPFTATASTLVRRGIPAVVAMRDGISDRAAIEFSRSFYAAVANRKPMDESVAEARKALSLSAPESAEWALPVLHLHASDGRLFDAGAASPLTTPMEVSTEGRGAGAPDAGSARRAVLDDLQAETTQRLAHLRRSGAYVELRTEVVPHDVVRRWDAEVPMSAGESPHGPDWPEGVLEVFDHAFTARRLLILGEPGAGKTTALTQLADALVRRAEEDRTEPIPVLVSLSSWTDGARTFDDWFLDELRRKYGMRRSYAQRLLVSRGLAVLFDGLDELPGLRLEPCVRALNHFQHTYRPPVVVVCSRTEEYRLSPTRLELNAAIRLLPLDDAQVRSALADARTMIWQAMSDPDLTRLARTPLFLMLIVRAREAIASPDLPGAPLATRLLDAYIRRLLADAGRMGPYPSADVRHWLGAIARRMRADGRDEFLIERMQPDWLETRAARWSYRAVVVVATGAAVAGFSVLQSALLDRLVSSSPLTARVVASAAPAWLPLDEVVLLAACVAAGGVVASQTTIRPIETLRWSSSAAMAGLRHFPGVGAARGGLAGWYLGLLLLSVMAAILSFGASAPSLGPGATPVAVIPVFTGCWGLAAWPGRGRLADLRLRQWRSIAVLVGLLVGLLIGLPFLEPTVSGVLGLALTVAGVTWLFGVSGVMDDRRAKRAAGAFAISYLAGLAGLGVLIQAGAVPALPWRLWPQFAVGCAVLPGSVAALTKRGPSWPAREVTAVASLRHWGVWGAGAVLLAAGAAALVPRVLPGAPRVLVLTVYHAANVVTGALEVLWLPVLMAATLAALGALVGVVVAIGRGVTGPDVQRRAAPNQGIRLSAGNVGRFYLIGLAAGVPYGALNVAMLAVMAGALPGWSEVARAGVGAASMVGMTAALVPASACVQHFALRLVLWNHGVVPWRYGRFLDHATDGMLVQRVGGRYRFLHVLLRDHLAGPAIPGPTPTPVNTRTAAQTT